MLKLTSETFETKIKNSLSTQKRNVVVVGRTDVVQIPFGFFSAFRKLNAST